MITIETFELFHDLSNIVDSMQMDSGTCVATASLSNGEFLDLMVYGEVCVDYEANGDFVNGNVERYDTPSEFNADMKEMLANGTFWTSDKVVINANNWFEFTTNQDGGVAEDVDGKNEEELKEMFVDWANYLCK